MSELIKVVLLFGLFLVPAETVLATEIDDYQRSFDLYRQAYVEFEIKKSDFSKSPTFAAEESLVNSAREMLLLRNDSWINYWKTMSILYGTVASEPEPKILTWNQFFKGEIDWLNTHKDGLIAEKVHKELLNKSGLMDAKREMYLTKSYEINVSVIAGRLIDALLQLQQLNDTLLEKAQNQKISTEKQEAAIRGLKSNLERIVNLKTDVLFVKQDFMDESGFVDKEQFSGISQDFIPLYQQLERIMLVTRELAKDIQW